MNVLRARSSVRFDMIRPAGFRILGALDLATQTCQVDLEITSDGSFRRAAFTGLAGGVPRCAVEASSVKFSLEDLWRGDVRRLLGPG